MIARRPAVEPTVRDTGLAAVGYGGGALCLTLVYLGMRSVMDVGGMCAHGGPYVSAQPCPEGAPLALMLGIFGLFLFGGLATVAGLRIGGAWAGAPILGWGALFGSLGWNFLDYGVFNLHPGEGIAWGWLICGVVFWLMAAPALVFFALGFRDEARSAAAGDGVVLPMPSRRPKPPIGQVDPAGFGAASYGSRGGARGGSRNQARPAGSPPLEAPAWVGTRTAAVLAELGDSPPPGGPAVVASTPSVTDGGLRPAGPEDATAMLDRLERLAALRDRGMITARDFETAKTAIMAELEAKK